MALDCHIVALCHRRLHVHTEICTVRVASRSRVLQNPLGPNFPKASQALSPACTCILAPSQFSKWNVDSWWQGGRLRDSAAKRLLTDTGSASVWSTRLSRSESMQASTLSSVLRSVWDWRTTSFILSTCSGSFSTTTFAPYSLLAPPWLDSPMRPSLTFTLTLTLNHRRCCFASSPLVNNSNCRQSFTIQRSLLTNNNTN